MDNFFGNAIGEAYKLGKQEQERRKNSPVLVKWPDIQKQLAERKHVYVIDPRLGFNNRTHRLWYDRIPPESEDGREWMDLGHRHTVEAIIYFLKGHGHSIIDGVRYDWEAGDLLSVPMFSWHRHINDGKEEVLRIASTTNPLSISLGQAVYEDERHPEFWVFAQEGQDAQKTLIPGGSGNASAVDGPTDSHAAKLYAEQVAFAMKEEKLRRESKVLVKKNDIKLERTAMGNMAYVVDSRIGFHSKALAVVVAEIPVGKRSGAHRHLYDEIDLVEKGQGRIVVDDKEYEFNTGDVLSIPVFAWHQYFNTGNEPLRIVGISTRPALENLGLVLTHQGELADH
jgi:gentisate 1,2-dioxygenase